LTKTDLIEKVAEKAGMTKKDAGEVVNIVFDSITDFLAGEAKKAENKRKKVQIIGFGSFDVRDRKPRKGLNPRTKAEISIPAKKVPNFKPGKALKESVDI